MDKQKEIHKLNDYFGLKRNAKYIFFQNPKRFSYLELERINPNHKMVIWGILRRKYRKHKPLNKIKVGKINIPVAIIILNIANINFEFGLWLSQIFLSAWLSYIIYYLPVYGVERWLKTISQFRYHLLSYCSS